MDVTLTGTGSTISGGSGLLNVTDNGTSSTIIGGTGELNVTEAGAGAVILGGSGPLDVTDTGTNTSIVASSGATTVTAINASPVVFGVAGADVQYVNDSAGTGTVIAGAGNETLNAAGSTVATLMFAGSGNDALIGGSGNDTLISGSGSASMTGGAGDNAFVIVHQAGEPTNVITDYNANDTAIFDGYATSDVMNAFANATVTGGSSFIDLSDGTTVTFLGVTSLGTIEWAANPCFVAGTRIRTERGAVSVEALCVGDRVPVEIGGTSQPIVWLGHRRVDCKRHPRPTEVWPIRLSAGAFGPGRPFRDLFLSPDHALFIDGVLIPVRYLVNGRTIRQEVRDEVSYWHVELGEHNVLHAEGVPAESYLDSGNRGAFANGGAAVALHPNFALRVWEAQGCAPLVLDGPPLASAKRRLLARARYAGHATTSTPNLRVLLNGKQLGAAIEGQDWRIRLPRTTANIRLVSRNWTPAHVQPGSDDTRNLGVAISRLCLDGHEVAPDSHVFASGWQAHEPDGRWTDGDASLDVTGARELSFRVAMTGTYWLDKPTRETRTA
jgi:hypothetical protein